VDQLDNEVNRMGGMFRAEAVRGWERGLDEMASIESTAWMRGVRDKWVFKVGWLVGRTASTTVSGHTQAMEAEDEDEEL